MPVIEIKAPNHVSETTHLNVFLAGAIDMGHAVHWQEKVVEHFKDKFTDVDICFINPRRDDWDSTWKQTPDDPQFSEQVNWELFNILHNADIVFVHFPEDSKAPIILLELGLALGSRQEVVVSCNPNFYRHGNVVITCDRFMQSVIAEWDTAMLELEFMINTKLRGMHE